MWYTAWANTLLVNFSGFPRALSADSYKWMFTLLLIAICLFFKNTRIMKTFKYLVMSIVAICLVACSNGTSLKPVSKKVNGPLGNYFEVVEREYRINDNSISVELKRIEEGGPEEASWASEPTFIVELLDEGGNVISSESSDVVLKKDQLETIFSLGMHESSSITLKFNETSGAVSFKVSSKWNESADEQNEVDEYDDNDIDFDEDLEDDDIDYDEDESSHAVTSTSEDWDALLDSYDSYVTKYVSLVKKAAEGDLGALAEYPELAEKAQEISERMEKAQGEMSPSQWAKYMKIAQKMMSAATELF